MSLNCLTCQVFQTTDSDWEYLPEKGSKKVDRSWSGNIAPPQLHHDQIVGGAVAMIKTQHRRRVQSAGNVPYPDRPGPRLVRSCAMRRDWSFEDLAEKKSNERRVRFR